MSQKLGEIEVLKQWRLLQVGYAGAGKTTAATTFAKRHDGWVRTYVFDLENKMDSAIDYWRHESKEDYEAAMELIERDVFMDGDASSPNAINDVEAKIGELQDNCPYDVVIFDSATGLEISMMNQIIKTRPSEGRQYFKIGKKTKEIPVLADYGILVSHMERLIIEMVAIDATVIVNAHVKRTQNKKTSVMYTGPLVVGDVLPAKLPGWFNEVHFLWNEEGKAGREYLRRTRPHEELNFLRTSMRKIDDVIPQEYRYLEEYYLAAGGK